MKIITFNILKPLAFSALFIVFAAGLNTASAEGEVASDPVIMHMKLTPSETAYEKSWLEHHKSEWESDNKDLGLDPN